MDRLLYLKQRVFNCPPYPPFVLDQSYTFYWKVISGSNSAQQQLCTTVFLGIYATGRMPPLNLLNWRRWRRGTEKLGRGTGELRGK